MALAPKRSESSKMADEITVRAAGIILYRMIESGPEFLLLRNARHGTWGFPKGHCECGEPADSTARRETVEETGMTIERFRTGFEKIVTYSIVPTGWKDEVTKSVVYFLAESHGSEVDISDEHSQVLWEDRLAARRILQFDLLRELLDCAHSRIAELERFETDDLVRARSLLDELSRPDEPWLAHSKEVACVAGLMAREVVARRPELPVDPHWVEAAALLHDIGRSRSHGIYHSLEGFRLLEEKGLGHLSKACISHWLKGRSRKELEADSFFTPELLEELFGELKLEEFTLSEKLVALADSLVMSDQRVTVDKRYSDAMERYGVSSWMRDNLAISKRLLAETSALLEQPVYDLIGLKDGSRE